MTAVAIFNPASGSASRESKLVELFGANDVTMVPTTKDDPGIGQAAAAVRDGASTVIACGGDGTVRAVVQSLAGTAAVLGIVPEGTGNLLASNLQLRNGKKAAEDALHGPTRTLDVGVVNDERFAVMAGVGFDATMIRDANPKLKKRLGTLAYVGSALKHLPGNLVTAIVSIDGKQVWTGRTTMVLVGNCGTVSGGIEVFPDAQADDGHLDVAVLEAATLRQWLVVGWKLVRRKQQDSKLLKRFTGTSIEVTLSRSTPWELDGEPRDPATSLRFSIEPRALKVRVPHT